MTQMNLARVRPRYRVHYRICVHTANRRAKLYPMTHRTTFDPDAERARTHASWMQLAVRTFDMDPDDAEMLFDLTYFYGWSAGAQELIEAVRRDGLVFAVASFEMQRSATVTLHAAQNA